MQKNGMLKKIFQGKSKALIAQWTWCSCSDHEVSLTMLVLFFEQNFYYYITFSSNSALLDKLNTLF